MRAKVRGHDFELGRDDREGFPVTIRHIRQIGVTARVTVTHAEYGELVLELPRARPRRSRHCHRAPHACS